MDSLLTRAQFPPGPIHPCPYLPDRQARNVGVVAERLEAETYARLLERGFRRSGTLFYQPACPACQECVPVRIPVDDFRPSHSQRRVWRRNTDIRVGISPPQLTTEKWQLYGRYLEARHPGGLNDSYDDLRRFLYCSPVDTEEVCYFAEGRLIGVSIIDVSRQAVSSVYMFFDPQEQDRSLGTYSTLWEIEECRRRGVRYYYLGYYIAGCGKMNYKVRFKPHEQLHPGRGWVVDSAVRSPGS